MAVNQNQRGPLAPPETDVIADGRDAAAVHGDIRISALPPRTVDHDAVAYDQIVHEAILGQVL